MTVTNTFILFVFHDNQILMQGKSKHSFILRIVTQAHKADKYEFC
jgi:hypothetical protein